MIYNESINRFWKVAQVHPELDQCVTDMQSCNQSACRSGVVVSALASIDEVNQCRARLVQRRVTVSGFNSRCRTTSHPMPTQPSIAPGLVNEYQLQVGRQKAGMVHSVSGWTRGVQVKLSDPLRTRAIPERLRGMFTTRRYTNVRLPLPLPYLQCCLRCHDFCGPGNALIATIAWISICWLLTQQWQQCSETDSGKIAVQLLTGMTISDCVDDQRGTSVRLVAVRHSR